MANSQQPHVSVLLNEVIAAIDPTPHKVIIDCTFGAGGYSRAVLKYGAEVIGIDQDPNVKTYADQLKKEYKNFTFVNNNYSQIDQVFSKVNIKEADGIMMDLGVSSMQLDEAHRGFSFQQDGPLDMRMGNDSISAYDIVNTYKEEDIANIIYYYGGEKKSRQIAKQIINYRQRKKFETTLELADLIAKIVKRSPKNPIHPATRTFQAIRIAVNDELNHLKMALEKSIKLLAKDGTIAVVSFHSLEDAIVKSIFKTTCTNDNNYQLVHKKPLTPSAKELLDNPRASSAKLRALRRVS